MVGNNVIVNGGVEAFCEKSAFYESYSSYKKLTIAEKLIVKPGESVTTATLVTDLTNTSFKENNYVIIYKEDVKYPVLEGDNLTPTLGTEGALSFKSEGDSYKFLNLYLDEALVDKSNYTVTEGATIITLNADYVKSLSLGTKMFELEFIDGYSIVNMEVKKPEVVTPPTTNTDSTVTNTDSTATNTDSTEKVTQDTTPSTGDTNSVALFLIISLIAVGGIVVTALNIKRVNK